MAASLYCIGRQQEAEQHWLRAVKLQPSYFDSTEHLVGHLYKSRSKEAIEVITFIQRALSKHRGETRPKVASTSSAATNAFIGQSAWRAADVPSVGRDGFGSSGYNIDGSENGRLLALIHAKGTMLYNLKNIEAASQAFEEAVLIGVGRHVASVKELIRHIQVSLASKSVLPADQSEYSVRSLMLPPERARQSSQLVFGAGGELPGLQFLRNPVSKRAAVQTSSNALLSLAKIFQDSMSTGAAEATLSQSSSNVTDILALYYLSLSLQDSPSTANNVGILLAGIQQTACVTPPLASQITTEMSIPGIPHGSGLALALSYYNYGLRLDPNHVHLHTNLGSLLKDVGQLDLAIQMYERAVSCDGTFDIALTNLANAVKDKGRINDAVVYYRRAVAANPAFCEAVCGLLTALNSICNWRGRGGVALDDGKYDRWHVNDDGMLVDSLSTKCGSGLTKRVVDIVDTQLKEGSQWGLGALQVSSITSISEQLQGLCGDSSFDLTSALAQWAGKPCEGSRVLRLVERAARVRLRRSYKESYARDGKSLQSPLTQHSRPRIPQSLTVPPAPTVLPFHTFTCPLTACQIRAIAQRNATRISLSTLRSPWISSTFYPPPPPPNPQLNVGYISSDFNNHPLAHLYVLFFLHDKNRIGRCANSIIRMQSTFGFHDHSRVRAICYATTASDGSVHRRQIESEAPAFRDVSAWPPDKLVNQIVSDEVHILVNLNGYTRGARNEIFAARPAPIQMSFMGFAGTLGAEWCDYILADQIAIPPETLRPWRNNVSIEDIFLDDNECSDGDWMYSENVIFCRDTFFCCDHAQSADASEKSLSWFDVERRRWQMRKELFPSLGDDAVILANFNQLYKVKSARRDAGAPSRR